MCDCETPEFFEVATPVARKAYRCCECKAEIAPGEKYVRSTGKWEGTVASFVQCESCATLGKEFSRHLQRLDGCCVNFGELWESIYWERRDGGEQDAEHRLTPTKVLAAALAEQYRESNRRHDEDRRTGRSAYL